MQYKDDQYAPSLHVEEFDDSLLYCGTTSLVPKTILPNSSLFVPSLYQYLHLIQALVPLLLPSSQAHATFLCPKSGCWLLATALKLLAPILGWFVLIKGGEVSCDALSILLDLAFCRYI